MELSEAAQIHQGLQDKDSNNSLHNMKAILKTWKNRLPVVADDLSHWSDVFVWRQHHYQFVIEYCSRPEHSSNAVLGVHASAQVYRHLIVLFAIFLIMPFIPGYNSLWKSKP